MLHLVTFIIGCALAGATQVALVQSGPLLSAELYWCYNKTATCVKQACTLNLLPTECCLGADTPFWDYSACGALLAQQPYGAHALYDCMQGHSARCDFMSFIDQVVDATRKALVEVRQANAELVQRLDTANAKIDTMSSDVTYLRRSLSEVGKKLYETSTESHETLLRTQSLQAAVATVSTRQELHSATLDEVELMVYETSAAVHDGALLLQAVHVVVENVSADNAEIKRDMVKWPNVMKGAADALDVARDSASSLGNYFIAFVVVGGLSLTLVLYACAACRWGPRTLVAAPPAYAPPPVPTIAPPAYAPAPTPVPTQTTTDPEAEWTQEQRERLASLRTRVPKRRA